MARNLIKVKNMFDDTLYGYAWNCKKPKANILIMTGMQETALRYDDFAKFLNSHNYDVYCIDAYGQGLNIQEKDIPGIWPKSGFSKCVKSFGDVVEQLRVTGLPTYIFGHSMGSFMAQDFIQRFNQLVTKVVLCGSDYAKPSLMQFAYRFAKLGLNKNNRDITSKNLAKLVTGSFNKKIKNAKTEFDWLSYNEENVNKYIADPKCGFTATTGFYVEFLKGMSRLAKKKYLRKIRRDIKIFIIAGNEDPVGHNGKGPQKLFQMYRSLNINDVSIKVYPNMRHEILNENKKAVVYNDILNFFEK